MGLAFLSHVGSLSGLLCRLRRWAALLALGSTAALAQNAPLVVGVDAEPRTYAYEFARLAYSEAFRRLGLPFQLVSFNLARRSALAEGGAIDIEAARVAAYAEAHPELVRTEEPIVSFTFALFTANPALRAKKLEELPPGALLEYRRGILMCENILKKHVPPERLSNVVSTDQGLKKLLSGRSDAYCDIDVYVREAMQSDELRRATDVRRLFDIASLPTYPFLHKKHAELAPRLSAVLKQMRTEGLIASYVKQAERLAGWVP